MANLGVNIDHIATLRQARGTNYPCPVEAALLAEKAGATSIVSHLREDRRHIQDKDVKDLKKRITTHLNLEMSIAFEIVKIALKIKPDQVTLVPEKRKELTTEGGLDVLKYSKRLRSIIKDFDSAGIKTSLFIDPVKKQVQASQDVGAQIIELHTGTYADAPKKSQQFYLKKIISSAKFAESLGVVVSAGHGLHYHNIQPLTQCDIIEEYNIGHSIIAQSVYVGIEQAVRDMVALVQ